LGHQILDSEDELKGPIIWEDSSGTRHSRKLEDALIMNKIPFMEGILAQLADGQQWDEGHRWIDAFFELQREMWLRGIVDVAPGLARRYGLGFYHGFDQVQGVALGSLLLDQRAIDAVGSIAARQTISSLP